MCWCGSLMFLLRLYEAAAVEDSQSLLHGTLREARFFGDVAVAEADARRALAARAAPEEQVHEEGGGRAVVADEVAEQDVGDVVVQCECLRGWRRRRGRRCHRKHYSRS